jgi:hypothetical protein
VQIRGEVETLCGWHVPAMTSAKRFPSETQWREYQAAVAAVNAKPDDDKDSRVQRSRIDTTPAPVRRRRSKTRAIGAMFARPFSLDHFGFLLIDRREVSARLFIGAQEFVELGLQGLRIAMLGALDHQGHEPRGQGGDAVPVK